MQDNGWDRALTVTAEGKGLVGHAGGILLRKLADQCGLTGELDAALARDGTSPQLSRDVVLVSTAIAIAMGATAMADIAVLGQLAPVLGAPPSGSAVRRTLNLADDRTLARSRWPGRGSAGTYGRRSRPRAGSRGWRSPARPWPGGCSSTWAAP